MSSLQTAVTWPEAGLGNGLSLGSPGQSPSPRTLLGQASSTRVIAWKRSNTPTPNSSFKVTVKVRNDYKFSCDQNMLALQRVCLVFYGQHLQQYQKKCVANKIWLGQQFNIIFHSVNWLYFHEHYICPKKNLEKKCM